MVRFQKNFPVKLFNEEHCTIRYLKAVEETSITLTVGCNLKRLNAYFLKLLVRARLVHSLHLTVYCYNLGPSRVYLLDGWTHFEGFTKSSC